MKNLIYDISDIPRPWYKCLIYAIQQVLAVFVATVLIASICGTPISSCLFGAGLATLIYQLITKFKSPMFISSCGATVSAVIGALTIGETRNYFLVVIGGLVIFLIYAILAGLVKWRGINVINKIFPPVIVGSITLVIGINLAGFIPTYVQVQGEHSNIGLLVALITMLTVALTSHYFKGFWKTIPFLFGLLMGYIVSIILTITNTAPLVNFSVFKNMTVISMPDWTFAYWSFKTITIAQILEVIALFTPVALCAALEHYSDHQVLSNIIGTNLTQTPGLHRTLLGDGTASFIGTIICGLPNTSYGESIATVGFSRVASTIVLTVASGIMMLLAFITPVQAILASIPPCVFGGCAMILYGYIAASGLKTLINSKTNFNDNKNLIVASVILTVGVSGIWLFNEAITGVALAMILGVLLNIILRTKK